MKQENVSKHFPPNFLWGSATSAYQVEGGNKNSDWELLAGKLGVPKAGRACDHYRRFEEDFDIAQSLNQNAHRFSIEWARIEPEKGEFDGREIEHYRQVLKALKKRGIEPLVTLHHFTNPQWVAQRGGWENSDTVSYFGSYVRFVVTQLSDLCDFWVTINEPFVYLSEGYLRATWPPRRRDPLAAFKVGRNMLKAHRQAYQIIHEIQPEAKVGVAYSLAYQRAPFNPKVNLEALWERWFIARAKAQDFIGVNYYRSVTLKPPRFLGFGKRRGFPGLTDIGWEIYPEGLHQILVGLKCFNLPIYITENGLADAKDRKRAAFIRDHLDATWRAVQEGVDVRGYFYWSLLDNFEWARGFGPRFGLAEVDYETLERKVRPSASVYANVAKSNALNP